LLYPVAISRKAKVPKAGPKIAYKRFSCDSNVDDDSTKIQINCIMKPISMI
jgi:hypothetical protein